MKGRLGQAIAAGIAMLALAPGAAAAPRGAMAPPYRLGFLHVGAVAGAYGLRPILDAQGRTVLLRGVNVNGLEDYWQDSKTPLAVPYPIDPRAYAHGLCPARNVAVESMAMCDFDPAQMRALGYDSVRLAVSWSLLEPRPGQVDTTMIDRIAQVVGWLKAAGLYSIIDMHQDAWSKYVYSTASDPCVPPFKTVGGFHEADGAPAWASIPHATPACALNGTRELDAAVQEDFQRFWSDLPAPDGRGLQEHYADAVLALARRFHDEPAVAGYELFNEPSPGFVAPPVMDAAELFPFYARVVRDLTAHVRGFHQLVFVEPDITRDITDQSAMLLPWSAYSGYRNVVYAPHVYTRVFTPDAQLNAAAGTPTFLPMNEGYDSAVRDAAMLGLPLWIGEFGNGVAEDDVVLRQHYRFQDQYAIGSSLWVWKADEAAGFSIYHGPFGAGVPFTSRVRFTSRVYPIFTAGTLGTISYDLDAGTFELHAVSRRMSCGDRDRATVVFIPAAASGAVAVSGARTTTVAVDGGRLAFVYPDGGDYRMTVGLPGAAPGCG